MTQKEEASVKVPGCGIEEMNVLTFTDRVSCQLEDAFSVLVISCKTSIKSSLAIIIETLCSRCLGSLGKAVNVWLGSMLEYLEHL